MFGKKPKVSDILKLIERLSEEEKEELFANISPETADVTPDEGVETQSEVEEKPAEENSEATEENVEKTEEATETDANEAEVEEPSENSQEDVNTEEHAQEEVSEEAPTEERAPESIEQSEDVKDTQTARIEALESEIQAIKEMLAKSLEDKDFGLQPRAPEGKNGGNERYSAVMRGYAGGNAKNYY